MKQIRFFYLVLPLVVFFLFSTSVEAKTVTVNVAADNIIDSGNPATVKKCNVYGDIGSWSAYGGHTYRYLAKIKPSANLVGYTLKKAVFKADEVSSTWDDDQKYIMQISEPVSIWNPDTLAWNNQPRYKNIAIYPKYVNNLYEFDITDEIKEWLQSPTEYLGIMIRKEIEDTTLYSHKGLFTCANYSTSGAENIPVLEMTYESNYVGKIITAMIDSDMPGTRYYINSEEKRDIIPSPAIGEDYANAVLKSCGLDTAENIRLTSSQLSSFPLGKTLTVKAGSNYLLKRETSNEYYVVDHDNYLLKVDKTNYTNYQVVSLPDNYFGNYLVMKPIDKSDLVITRVEFLDTKARVYYKNNSNVVIPRASRNQISIEFDVFSKSYSDGFVYAGNQKDSKTSDFQPYEEAYIDFPALSGAHDNYVTIIVDYGNAIAETDEANNTYQRIIRAQTGNILPDLSVGDVGFMPKNPTANVSFDGTLHVNVINSGGPTNSRNNAGVRVAVALSDLSGVLYVWNSTGGIKTIPDMAANTAIDVVFPINNVIFNKTGMKIRVWLDSNAITDGNKNDNLAVDESNEDNNYFERDINLSGSDSGDLLNLRMDRVALRDGEVPKNYLFAEASYPEFDPEANNSGATVPREYVEQTLSAVNYEIDGQYYTTGLRIYNSIGEADYLFNYHNTQHTRTVISLSDFEKFGDGVYCHVVKPGDSGVTNTNGNGRALYYYICGFKYKNIYIYTQAMTESNSYVSTLALLKEYWGNIVEYNDTPLLTLKNFNYYPIDDDQGVGTQIEFNLVNASRDTVGFNLVAWNDTTKHTLKSESYSLSPQQSVLVYLMDVNNMSYLAPGSNNINIKLLSPDNQKVYLEKYFIAVKGQSPGDGDETGLQLSNIQVPDRLIRTDRVTVVWETNIDSTSFVTYAPVGESSEMWQGVDSLTKKHTVLIPNLKSLTTYRFRVSSKDKNGNVKRSEIMEFTTTSSSSSEGEIEEGAYRLYENKISEILAELKELRNTIKEQNVKIKYLEKLTDKVQKLSANMESAINTFIAYGVDDNTKKLGEGERAAVMYSYKAAFDKLPETENELADVIKIANGRWPGATSSEAEKQAKEQFRKIYKRIADMNDPSDNAAVTVMAYGLRQKAENRDLNSEKEGIKIFKNIYGYNPSSTEDWNLMQAITYSGAKRMPDADKDYLSDDLEKAMGTDVNNPDSDGDGYIDGIEVENSYSPLG